LVPQSGLTVIGTISVVRNRYDLLATRSWHGRRERSELFDRAQADSVGFAEGAIDGPGLGDAHLGPADQRRDVRRIGVAIPDETARARSLVNDRFEDPASHCRVGISLDQSGLYAGAMAALGNSKQARVRDIPTAIQKLNIPR